MKTPKWCAAAVMVAVLGTTAGCAAASYDERMDYLKTIAQQGVEVHDLIESQEGDVTKDRCESAFEGVSDYSSEAPSDLGGGSRTKEWTDQIKLFFVDSCVSGVPKEIEAPGKTESPAQDS